MTVNYKIKVILYKDDVETKSDVVVDKTLDETHIVYLRLFEFLYGKALATVNKLLDVSSHFSILTNLLDLLDFN